MSYMSHVKVYIITLYNRSYKGLVHPQIGHEAVAAETSRAARQEKTFESGPQKGHHAIYSHMDVVWLDASSGSPTEVDDCLIQ